MIARSIATTGFSLLWMCTMPFISMRFKWTGSVRNDPSSVSSLRRERSSAADSASVLAGASRGPVDEEAAEEEEAAGRSPPTVATQEEPQLPALTTDAVHADKEAFPDPSLAARALEEALQVASASHVVPELGRMGPGCRVHSPPILRVPGLKTSLGTPPPHKLKTT